LTHLYVIGSDYYAVVVGYAVIRASSHAKQRKRAWLRAKKICYRNKTARCTMSVETLSNAAQMYEKSHLKRLAVA